MKIRAKKEAVVAFLEAHKTSTKLVNQKSGWSTIRWVEKEKSKTDAELKAMWDEFFKTRSKNFEDKMSDAIEKDAKEMTKVIEETMEPTMIYQKAYNGNTEALPAGKFTEKIECKCGEIRWVQRADVFQVTKCKPCTIKNRRTRQYQRRKTRKNAKKGSITTPVVKSLELQGLIAQ
jgi:hypothetical protein